jgi:hypothetical protein
MVVFYHSFEMFADGYSFCGWQADNSYCGKFYQSFLLNKSLAYCVVLAFFNKTQDVPASFITQRGCAYNGTSNILV